MSTSNERLYSASVVATLAGVSRRMVPRDVKDGFITPHKVISSQQYFTKEEMLHYARWRRKYPKLVGLTSEMREAAIKEGRRVA